MQAQLLSSGYDSEWGKPVEGANECGGVNFCCKTPGSAAVVHDEDISEMKWLRETKRAELFAVPTGTQKITVYVLVVYARMDFVFANTSALRAVRKFEVSQKQVVPKHKLLVVEIDLEMYTAIQMVMVRQIKLEAPDPSKLKKDLGEVWEGKRSHFVERCDRWVLMKRGRCSPMLTEMPS